MNKILIVDDDPQLCKLLTRFLERNDYEAESVHKGDDAIDRIRKSSYDLVLCDFKLPDANGDDILQKIKILNPKLPVIIITGYSDVKTAVQTLRHGAYDYVTKPIVPDEIILTIKNAIGSQKKEKEIDLEADTSKTNKKKFVYGESQKAIDVQNHVNLIAPTEMSVIIIGETGTGKEFVANAIHEKSKRSDKPFVAIDCGAIPKDLAGSELFGHVKGAFTGALADKKGSFEVADGGTLFLDEIGNLSYDNQIKLLRVLQERTIKRLGSNKDIPIDVRVIVATNENLKRAIQNETFREDIYHRLNEFTIKLAPLRERAGDIVIYAEHFLQIANNSLNKNIKGFDNEALRKLMDYYWHGNLRELRNVVQRSVLLCQSEYISISNLPEEIVTPPIFEEEEIKTQSVVADVDDLKEASKIAERAVIINALKKAGYNKSKAARELQIDRKTLYNKLKIYDINI